MARKVLSAATCFRLCMCLSVYLSVCLGVFMCGCICLSVSLSVSLCECITVCMCRSCVFLGVSLNSSRVELPGSSFKPVSPAESVSYVTRTHTHTHFTAEKLFQHFIIGGRETIIHSVTHTYTRQASPAHGRARARTHTRVIPHTHTHTQINRRKYCSR